MYESKFTIEFTGDDIVIRIPRGRREIMKDIFRDVKKIPDKVEKEMAKKKRQKEYNARPEVKKHISERVKTYKQK